METKFYIDVVRRDRVKVELDPEFFTEEWFENIRKYNYEFETLEECAQHIAFHVIHNESTYIEGFGIPLHNGKRPDWIKDEEKVNEHINIIYDPGDTDVECL
ncbi:hypothetical protein ACNZ61_003000 [Enterococcus hirae]